MHKMHIQCSVWSTNNMIQTFLLSLWMTQIIIAQYKRLWRMLMYKQVQPIMLICSMCNRPDQQLMITTCTTKGRVLIQTNYIEEVMRRIKGHMVIRKSMMNLQTDRWLSNLHWIIIELRTSNRRQNPNMQRSSERERPQNSKKEGSVPSRSYKDHSQRRRCRKARAALEASSVNRSGNSQTFKAIWASWAQISTWLWVDKWAWQNWKTCLESRKSCSQVIESTSRQWSKRRAAFLFITVRPRLRMSARLRRMTTPSLNDLSCLLIYFQSEVCQ